MIGQTSRTLTGVNKSTARHAVLTSAVFSDFRGRVYYSYIMVDRAWYVVVHETKNREYNQFVARAFGGQPL